MPSMYKDKFHLEGGELIRQVTFGMNDGIVSIFALLAGIAGAGQDKTTILIALLAAAVAGAISMAAGEFISAKGEIEFFRHEIEQERLEIHLCPDIEKEELSMIYASKGFKGKELESAVNTVIQDEDMWVKEMVIEELGIADIDDEIGIKTSGVIFLSFILGSLFPVLPYLVLKNSALSDDTIFYIATFVTFGGLFFVGAIKKFVTGIYWLKSGVEMLIVGLFAYFASYGIGLLFEPLIG